jgi:hypothetical protein
MPRYNDVPTMHQPTLYLHIFNWNIKPLSLHENNHRHRWVESWASMRPDSKHEWSYTWQTKIINTPSPPTQPTRHRPTACKLLMNTHQRKKGVEHNKEQLMSRCWDNCWDCIRFQFVALRVLWTFDISTRVEYVSSSTFCIGIMPGYLHLDCLFFSSPFAV